MDHFQYQNGQLCAEQVTLAEIAQKVGTPTYVYSRATLERHWQAFDQAFGERPHLICFAVKANSNLAVLDVLARLGSGFDIVSGGELERVLAAGGKASKVVFSGVGKTKTELKQALSAGIRCFNVESAAELAQLNQVACDLGQIAPVSLRVNPDVDAHTHPYISTGLKENKFGIPIEEALTLYQQAAALPNLAIKGVDCHIGSQLTDLEPFLDALERVLRLVDQLKTQGIQLEHLDLGGGLGVRYSDENPPEPADYAKAIIERLDAHQFDPHCEILLEPGRAIAANAGVLLTQVILLKSNGERRFAVIDAAMNDLIRPALYQAEQPIVTLAQQPVGETATYDLVGPVCETGDFLGKARPLTLDEGSLLAIRGSGAYGFSMASNYNSRPRGAEVMVDAGQFHVVRQRERVETLYALEQRLPDE